MMCHVWGKTPFALSLSKGFPSWGAGEGKGFDKLSPNGFPCCRPSAFFEALP
jgi:hypothetical protein